MAVRYYVDEDDDLLIGIASGLIAVDQLITALNKIITETNGAAFYKNHLFILEQELAVEPDGLRRVVTPARVSGILGRAAAGP